MKVSLTKGLPADIAKDVTQEFYSSANLRKQIAKVLQDKIDSYRKANTLSSSYDNPNWALKQADSVGYERAMTELISLIISKDV